MLCSHSFDFVELKSKISFSLHEPIEGQIPITFIKQTD